MFCVLGVFLQRAQTNARAAGGTDAFGRVVQALVLPVSGSTARAVTGTREFWQGLTQAADLRRENRLMRSELNAARMYRENVDRLERELDAIRSTVSLPALGKDKILTEVIAWFPHENRVTLSAGEDRDLRPMMPVVTGDGLVGTIQTVEARRSQALLITSPQTKIGAILANRNPPPAGMLRGETPSTLSLQFDDPNAVVQNGDVVTTAGFSERIPRGIPIGKVIEVSDNPEFGTRRATVLPNVAIGLVREVIVLR